MPKTKKPAADIRLKDLMPEADDVTPRYLQLARKLASAIQAGDWKPNEVLPAERELCEQLGIARSTLESKIRSLRIDKHRFKSP